MKVCIVFFLIISNLHKNLSLADWFETLQFVFVCNLVLRSSAIYWREYGSDGQKTKTRKSQTVWRLSKARRKTARKNARSFSTKGRILLYKIWILTGYDSSFWLYLSGFSWNYLNVILLTIHFHPFITAQAFRDRPLSSFQSTLAFLRTVHFNFWTVHFRGPSTLCRFKTSTLFQDHPLLGLWTVHIHQVGPFTFLQDHSLSRRPDSMNNCPCLPSPEIRIWVLICTKMILLDIPEMFQKLEVYE